jgi:AAA domain
MRLTRLSVESFQGIDRADIDFAPGLNVVFGPNDLGKSTLATAIRAAFLVPPTSSDAESYLPWHKGATPRVSLTFQDARGLYWRVSKAFGDERRAELLQSKDGVSFVVDATARQVEEKIRQLLKWGIPAPGGRGAPRGVPASFLANALLAAQTNVDDILGASLASDLEDSGKQQLSKALETLARDPLFKKILDEAQRECDTYFTPTGRRKTGQNSPFTTVGDAVKKLSDDRTALERLVAESSAIEGSVSTLREQRDAAIERVNEATSALGEVRRQLEGARQREQAGVRLDAATRSLAAIDAHAARVATIAGELTNLAAAVRDREKDALSAASECIESEAAVRGAEEAHRTASSAEGARRRELRRAQLSEQVATMGARRQAAQSRKAKIEAAIAARTIAQTAANRAASAKTDAEASTRRVGEALEKTAGMERELEFARSLVAYGKWRTALSATEEASRANEQADADRQLAQRKDAEAITLEGRAAEIETDFSDRAKLLPGEKEIEVIARLERDLEIAEAAVGGGIRVAVRPRSNIGVRVVADQREIRDDPGVNGERVVEAERRVNLSLGDVAEIEVVAGRAEQRRAVDEARVRWAAEGAMVIARAGAKSAAQLIALRSEVQRELARAADLRRDAEKERAEAKALRERSALHEERATRSSIEPGEVNARKAAIGPTPLEELEKRFAKLGKAWEPQAESAVVRAEREARSAQTEVAKLENAAELRTYQASEAEREAQSAAEASGKAVAVLEAPDPDALLRKACLELTEIDEGEAALLAELKALGAEATSKVEKALAALDSARTRLSAARERQATAVLAVDSARAEWNSRIGEHKALVAQLEAMNRNAAAELVTECNRELQALPPAAAAVSETDLSAAERRLEEAARDLDSTKEDLHKAEGALSKVGGDTVREEVARLDDALEAARERERTCEVDADAWKLLRETLVEVEKRESAHLGRALGAPVTARFAELTGSRYGGLLIDQALKVEGVEVAGAAASGSDVLGALSVGTRNQLATLIRLTIADQLKSVIVLDDHLVHTDPKRLDWFRAALRRTALNAQVIVLTCRPEDYLSIEDLPAGTAMRDLGGGAVRAIDAAVVIRRWDVPRVSASG